MTDDPFRSTAPAALDPDIVRREIRRFLDEDLGAGDVTTARVVPGSTVARGAIVAREPCVAAGLEMARTVFAELDGTIDFAAQVTDGARVAAGTSLAGLQGPAG